MAIKDLGKKMSDSLRDAADAVRSKAAQAEMPDLKKFGEKASEQVRSAFQRKDRAAEQNHEQVVPTAISAWNAVKVIYFLMAADGEVYHGEEEKFDAIGADLISNFDETKASILAECQADMGKVIDPGDHYDVIQDCVEAALLAPVKAEEATISTKLLVWDLLTVAYSDENYNDTERRLLKYIVRKLNLDKTTFLEMESSMLTVMAIERELTWIKATDRPYLKVEPVVSELTQRERVIFDNVKDMIAL